MLVSHNWLQNYFDQPLPSPEKLAELFTFHIFEVEGVEKKMIGAIGGAEDSIYDLKVLPDRAHYCLCHEGIAGEVSAMTGIPLKKNEAPDVPESETRPLAIEIRDWKACRRYIGRVIENVKVGESPAWLKDSLASIGQRSINFVVDAANMVMFAGGNPLHAFDADKVKGGIVVRYAKEGEHITTLDNKDVALNPETLVIADEEGPLAIAGIKGGKRAEVDSKTTALILEAANFEPALIRRTSQKLGIKTDASKRFENEISESKAEESMAHLSALIVSGLGNAQAKAGKAVDIYPSPRAPWTVTVNPEKVSALLGISIPESKIVSIYESLQMKVEKTAAGLLVTPPLERLDIVIPEDLVEEAGRLYGYDKIGGVPLPPTSFVPKQNGHFAAANLLRSILVKRGFSEIYGYALTDKGEVELANPLASDKSHLRTDLSAGLHERLKYNFSHTLFDKDSMKLFEVGTSFPKEGERLSVAFGSMYKNKKLNKSKEDIAAAVADIEAAFGMKLPPSPITARREDDTSAVLEIPLGDKIRAMKVPECDLSFALKPGAKFKPFSAYPRIIRDVALFGPAGTDAGKVSEIIRASMGSLVAEGPFLFDRFEKKAADGSVEKISLAYRMVFQSSEKTLSDEEVNPPMLAVIAALEKEGFEVRK